jgi:hypothetical protein
MLGRILNVCLGVALLAMPAFSQVIGCAVVNGNWTWKFTNAQYYLSQDNSGNVTGYAIEPGCQGNTIWPITGTIAGSSVTLKESNNGCTNSTVLYVNYTANVMSPGCNFLYGSYTNSNGGSGAWGDSNPYPSAGDWVTKAVDLPASETSAYGPPASWNPTQGGAPWIQTFSPDSPPSEFDGRGVYEFASGTGSDSCWFTQSKFAPFTSITKPGFGWFVTSNNTWGPDWIGWTLAAVQYYRAQKKVPRGAHFSQQAVIDAAYSPANPPSYTGPYTSSTNETFYGVPYEVNTLGGEITATSVTSVRNGQVATNTTW